MKQELLETIKIEDGQIFNLEWHNQRCNKSRLELFQEGKKLELKQFIDPPSKGLYRCRIRYDKEVNSVEYIPYTPKQIKSFKIVQSNIEYAYKYCDRSQLNQLKKQNRDYDEIIIEKNGLLTDTSIANIAFYNGFEWITPRVPLLEGTMRSKLLEENFLKCEDIKSHEIQAFSHFALMNAMIGFTIQKSVTIRL